MKLKERDLEFTFSDAIDAIIFDEMNDKSAANYHGVGAMHRVDFVVEFEEAIVFVEVKDPGNPKARTEGLQQFYDDLANDVLAKTFVAKYIESFIYRWAENRLDKPVHYLSLVTMDEELLGNLTDGIMRKMPPMNKAVPRWKRQFVNNCQVFNIDSWNENFPKWPVKRVDAK
ncbi:hypothetical protein [Acinetobacter sp. YH12085]|uniref:hypothetical protein n=1 Tax=Acinetobacter sp. YH12085 TaxID=2601077 RepID=UPI0015D1C62D|nr:hypothetical protein [Acinetobacter sp. YH12085]